MMLTETSGLPDSQGAALGPGVELNGRYVLESRLEHGRIGVVYKALDKQRSDAWGVPQHVALLVVPPHAVRGALLDPFKQAFAAVRLLRHPRIAAVYDFEAAGETFFLTMEYVDGESLRSVIDMLSPETLSRDEAWRVVAALGEALIYAHEAGVVHGDVRAENVVVAARGQVKMLFSPACLAASAPFVADEREDVFGLAELAYELLAGQKPPADALLTPRRRIQTTRIDGLSRGQWKALQAGLAGREERTRSVAQLLAGLDLERKARKTRKAPREPRELALAMRDSGQMPILGPADSRDEPAHHYDEPAQPYDEPAQRHDEPAQRHDRPTHRHDPPAQGYDDRPADRYDRQADADDRFADTNDRQVGGDDRFADTDDRLADADGRLADDDRLADADDRRADSHDRPAEGYVHPADDYDWPADGSDQNVETGGRTHPRSHTSSSPSPNQRPSPRSSPQTSTPTTPFPVPPPRSSSTASSQWSSGAPNAWSPPWPGPPGRGAGLRRPEYTPAAGPAPPPLPRSAFGERPVRPRLARRIGVSVVVLAVVMAALLALLRYGPMEIGRRAGATSVVALDAVRQHVIEPASRGVTGFVRAARERAAAGGPGGAGTADGGSADANRAAGDRVADAGGAPASSAANNGAAPASGAADAESRAPGTSGDSSALGSSERAPDASDRESNALANAPERARDAAEGGQNATERASGTSERPGASAIGSELAAESADRSDGADRSESEREPQRVATLPGGSRPVPNGAGPNAAEPASNAAGRVANAARPAPSASAPSAAASTPSPSGAGAYFTARELIASEGQTVVPVEIARSDSSSESAVLWWTADGTATAGNDYADLGGVIETFEPGQTSRTVFIPITNDSLHEERETFVVYVALQSPDGKPRNEPQSVRVTIVDDDF